MLSTNLNLHVKIKPEKKKKKINSKLSFKLKFTQQSQTPSFLTVSLYLFHSGGQILNKQLPKIVKSLKFFGLQLRRREKTKMISEGKK